MRCKNCGYLIPGQASDKCPNCDESPFEAKTDEHGAAYSKEVVLGKKFFKTISSEKRREAA